MKRITNRRTECKPALSLITLAQMERSTVGQAHEELRAAHEALQSEAQRQSDASAAQRREAAARDGARDAEEAAAVGQLHARMGELQVCGNTSPLLVLRILHAPC